MAKAATVDEYIENHPEWKPQLKKFKQLLNKTALQENIKWGGPIYSLNNKNLIGFGAFKNHLSLWFFHGALLKKNTQLLINAQEGKTKGLRQIRFDRDSEINENELLQYVNEAIELHKQGKIIKPASSKKLIIPAELSFALKTKEGFNLAFSNLTPGRQREYADYISEAKQEATRQKRLEKIIPMIKNGIGLNDKYKNC